MITIFTITNRMLHQSILCSGMFMFYSLVRTVEKIATNVLLKRKRQNHSGSKCIYEVNGLVLGLLKSTSTGHIYVTIAGLMNCSFIRRSNKITSANCMPVV